MPLKPYSLSDIDFIRAPYGRRAASILRAADGANQLSLQANECRFITNYHATKLANYFQYWLKKVKTSIF